MANKVKFNECLSVIPDALIWAEDQDVEGLKKFFIEDAQKPLYCIASGGSVSPIDYAALLYESKKGMDKCSRHSPWHQSQMKLFRLQRY